jgi:GMP synthase-like glutamine amidotransferase
MAGTRRFAILDCEDHPKWEGHERYFIGPLRREGEEWRNYRVWAGELPDDLGAVDGVVVTGSHYSVVDEALPWLPPLFAFLSEAAGAPTGPQVVGICFGCQALAQALGGRVGPNPHGRFVFGAERISLGDGFTASWFARGLDRAGVPGSTISLLQSHGECVLDLPPGAELLGRSESAAHEIFAVGSRVLALQGHPELDRVALVEKILPGLRDGERIDGGEEAALRSVEPAVDDELVMKVLRRFLDGPDG